MGGEMQLLGEIIAALGKANIFAFRRNVGAVEYRQGRWVKFGLPGQSDVWGIGHDGRHFEIEVKTPRGRLTRAQKDWIVAVRKTGAIAGVARSVEDALEIVADNPRLTRGEVK